MKMLTTMMRMMGMKKRDDEENYGNNSCGGDR